MAESRPLVSKASGVAEASWSICHARRTLLNQGGMHQFSIQNMYRIRIVFGPAIAVRANPGKAQDSEEIARLRQCVLQ